MSRHSDRFYSVLKIDVTVDESQFQTNQLLSSPAGIKRKHSTYSDTTLLKLLMNCCQDVDSNTRKFASFAGNW